MNLNRRQNSTTPPPKLKLEAANQLQEIFPIVSGEFLKGEVSSHIWSFSLTSIMEKGSFFLLALASCMPVTPVLD